MAKAKAAPGHKPAPATRDYHLVDITTTPHTHRIVTATSRGAAMLHAARTRYTIEPLSRDNAFELGAAGVKREIAVVGIAKEDARPDQQSLGLAGDGVDPEAAAGVATP